MTGQMSLWAIELSEFYVQYRPRTAIKGQVVADFIAEFTKWKARGQENIPNGVFTRIDRLTDRLMEQV